MSAPVKRYAHGGTLGQLHAVPCGNYVSASDFDDLAAKCARLVVAVSRLEGALCVIRDGDHENIGDERELADRALRGEDVRDD